LVASSQRLSIGADAIIALPAVGLGRCWLYAATIGGTVTLA
jgi:hypothetical protein